VTKRKACFHLSPIQKSFPGWHTPCIDLVGPYKFGDHKKPETHIELHCMTMIDPATGFFEIVEIGEKTADIIANWLELHWLTRYP